MFKKLFIIKFNFIVKFSYVKIYIIYYLLYLEVKI